MKLSIITVNRNNCTGLQKTIDSVISQTFKDFEWIIIDGGSTDGSKELIEQYAQYVTYWVSEPDKGIYNAMNKGILASHGKYLLFLNSGDWLLNKNVIQKTLPLLCDKDIYVGNMYYADHIGTNTISQQDFTPEGIVKKLTFSSFPHPSTFFKQTIFDTYGLYREDKRVASDWFLFYQSLIIGNATLEQIPLTISIFDTHGISSSKIIADYSESDEFLKEYPQISVMHHFLRDNYEIACALRSSNFIFFLFRLYFWLYRKIYLIKR